MFIIGKVNKNIIKRKENPVENRVYKWKKSVDKIGEGEAVRKTINNINIPVNKL